MYPVIYPSYYWKQPAPPHINLMITFSKSLNTIILVIGGYIYYKSSFLYALTKGYIEYKVRRLTDAAA